jgi:hypothetical protein
MPSCSPALPLPLVPAAAASNAHLHVVLPYAAMADSSCQLLLQSLHLPHLAQLLHRLSPAAIDEGASDHPIPPHERAVAATWGLNIDMPAWAACAQSMTDTPCAWLSPCHWTAGPDQVRMDNPAEVVLDMADAQALHALLQPWFEEDGMQLQVITPTRWCISGAPLQGLQTASLDRVLLRDVTPWMPAAATARPLHRLHSEVQMLLYNAAFNDQRAARGLAPINAFWLHGAGQLSGETLAHVRQRQACMQLHIVDALRQAALRQDWPAWQQAWLDADAGHLAALLRHVQSGGSATLTLSGEYHARSFTTAPRSLSQKIKNIFSPQRFAGLHQAL